MDPIYAFDLFGTVIFAITGAVKGVRLHLDFLGVLVFAITVGCAGGMIRDCLIGAVPVSSMVNPMYVVCCVLAGIVVFFIAPKVVGRWRIILFCDAIGLGVFTTLGADKAYGLGIGAIGQILAGVIGAVGGGVLRDVFSKEIPSVLTHDFYATASIIGAVIYVALEYCPAVPTPARFLLSALLTVIIRIYAITHKVNLPIAKMAIDDMGGQNA